jgi:hypothetical protein
MKHDYFKTWTKEMAYYLGWIWADGNISDGKLQLGCATEDEELILGFVNSVESKHKIIRKEAGKHKKGYNIAAYTKISVYSQVMINDLIDLHGILPRKTYLNPDFPNIPKEFVPHFIRGYFDGDGSIYKTKNKIGISIVGTKIFMEGMCKYLMPIEFLRHNKNTETKNAAWYIDYNSKPEVLSFLNYIYCGEPYLSRKKKLADSWKKELEEYCENCGITIHNKRIRLRFLGKIWGDYKTIEECKWARNYVFNKTKGYNYPIDCPEICELSKKAIAHLIDERLIGNKLHQRKIIT